MTTNTLPRPAAARRPLDWPAGVVRGRAGDAAWVRPSLLALLAATAVLYLWGLADSGGRSHFTATTVGGTTVYDLSSGRS